MAFRAILPILPYREPEVLDHISDLKHVFEKKNIRSVFIVTDQGIIRNGLLNPVLDVLDEMNMTYIVYDGLKPNPTVQNVEDGLTLYQENESQAIIAIGGGSAMDCGKAIGARAVNPKRSLSNMRGILKVFHQLPLLIAIPTTAGTGSETTLACVITDPKKHDKYALMDFPLIPSYAVLDTQMTRTLPPSLTATTGMDALTHAIEAYIGRSTTKETRSLAMHALKLIFENIQIAYEDGSDETARRNMALASYQAGIAFSKSYVGYVHAVAHSLGGMYDTPHGLANAVILPYVLELYGSNIHKKLHDLSDAAGLSRPSDTDEQASARLIQAIRDLNTSMKIPAPLNEIRKEDIRDLAHHAVKEANPLYPVPVIFDASQLEQVYHIVKGEVK